MHEESLWQEFLNAVRVMRLAQVQAELWNPLPAHDAFLKMAANRVDALVTILLLPQVPDFPLRGEGDIR